MLPTLILIAFAVSSVDETASLTRRIEERFLSPCCWRESLAVHRSPEANAMRADVRRLVDEGKSENEIVVFYVSRYGQRILREPQGGLAMWLRVAPLAFAASGFAFVTWYVIHSCRRTPDLACVGGQRPDIDHRL